MTEPYDPACPLGPLHLNSSGDRGDKVVPPRPPPEVGVSGRLGPGVVEVHGKTSRDLFADSPGPPSALLSGGTPSPFGPVQPCRGSRGQWKVKGRRGGWADGYWKTEKREDHVVKEREGLGHTHTILPPLGDPVPCRLLSPLPYLSPRQASTPLSLKTYY